MVGEIHLQGLFSDLPSVTEIAFAKLRCWVPAEQRVSADSSRRCLRAAGAPTSKIRLEG